MAGVAIPVSIYYGSGDSLADTTDIEQLLRELPNATLVGKHPIHKYAHLDFIWGLDAHEKMFPSIFAEIKTYAKHTTKK